MKCDRRWWNDGRLESQIQRDREGLWRRHDPIEAPRYRTPCEPIAEELLTLAVAKWWKFNRLRLTVGGIEVITEDQGGHPFVGLKVELVDSDENVRALCRAALRTLVPEKPSPFLQVPTPDLSFAAAIAFYTLPHEFVICAAIRLPDGRIFRGHRHGCCIRTAMESVEWNGGVNPGPHHWLPSMCRDQGFITSRNRYVDREEGMRLQLAAGIESVAPGGYRGQLFSEDLY